MYCIWTYYQWGYESHTCPKKSRSKKIINMEFIKKYDSRKSNEKTADLTKNYRKKHDSNQSDKKYI